MKKCAVIGSINMDMVTRVDRFPQPGETRTGSSFVTVPGGKGANQAVALGRLGAPVRMVGRVGDDLFGGQYLEHFARNGVDTACVEACPGRTTGVAAIEVNDAGENHIVVVPGANGACDPAWLEEILPRVLDADIFLMQLEIPLETVLAALERLKAAGKTIVLDPAPAVQLPPRALQGLTCLTPNETELRVLTAALPEDADAEARLRWLLAQGVGAVVHKAGADGAYIAVDGQPTRHVPGFKVKAVDTTAAGDTFNAGLCAGLAMGRTLEDSVRLGNAAAALSVTALGAQSGMPTLAEAEELLSFELEFVGEQREPRDIYTIHRQGGQPMTTYRKARPEDRAQYLDFINMVFSMAHRPHDFSKLLPKVYGPGRPTDELQNIAVDEAGHVRGLVAVLPGELRVGDKALRTGYVGSVSAHPFARGEGHMKALMKMAIDGAVADGADLMMLGGQRQRYEYFGFTPGGVEIRYTVAHANLRHALRDVDIAPYAFVPMEEADAALVDRAFALHEAQPVRMYRRREDFVVILESWLSRPYIVLKNGAFAGYLTASGDDKSFLEFLLSDEALYGPVVKAWMEQRGVRGLEIPAAAYNLGLNRVLSSFAEIAEIGTGQLLRVLNFPKVVAALLPLSGAVRPLADGELSLWIDGAPLTIAVKDGEVSVTEEAPEAAPHLTALAAQNLLFSPLGVYLGVSAPAGWLPLPLYMHSPDNF